MRNSRTVVISLILVGLLAVPAQAQVIPGRWEKVAALEAETVIIVNLKSGARLEGQFEGLSPSELFLRTRAAQAAVPRAEIQQITSRESDPLTNGPLIGAGVGVGIGLGIVVAAGGWEDEDLGSVAAVYSLIWAGIGALAGWGVDAIIWKAIVLYQAP